MSYAIQITRTSNGYILEWDEEREDDFVRVLYVIEEQEDENNDIKAMQKLLYFIKEHFGIYASKHNKENLVIEIRKTDE